MYNIFKQHRQFLTPVILAAVSKLIDTNSFVIALFAAFLLAVVSIAMRD